jgi:drug/metabolite transporter (DMT)-like permease
MGNTKRSTSSAYLALFIGLLIISSSPVMLKLAQAPGPVSIFYRFSIGTIVLTPFFIQYIKVNGRLSPKGTMVAMLAGLCLGFDSAAWSTGVMFSGAAAATLMANVAPVWVGLGAMFFFKQRLPLKFWSGLLVAIAGVLMIAGLDFDPAQQFDLGLLLAFIGGVFYASFFLLSEKGRGFLDALPFLWLTSISSAMVNGIIAVTLRHPLSGYKLNTWLWFVVMGVVVQALGWFVINYAQGTLPASLVSSTLLGQPVGAAILAWLFINEKLTNMQLAGGVIVLVGVFLVHHSQQKKKKPIAA